MCVVGGEESDRLRPCLPIVHTLCVVGGEERDRMQLCRTMMLTCAGRAIRDIVRDIWSGAYVCDDRRRRGKRYMCESNDDSWTVHVTVQPIIETTPEKKG